MKGLRDPVSGEMSTFPASAADKSTPSGCLACERTATLFFDLLFPPGTYSITLRALTSSLTCWDEATEEYYTNGTDLCSINTRYYHQSLIHLDRLPEVKYMCVKHCDPTVLQCWSISNTVVWFCQPVRVFMKLSWRFQNICRTSGDEFISLRCQISFTFSEANVLYWCWRWLLR